MGGASSSAAASAASQQAAAAASRQATQAASQQATQASRQALASGLISAADKIGDAYAKRKTAYSPEMNSPIFPNQKYKFGPATNPDILNSGMGVMTAAAAGRGGGGMYSGANFSNPARRGF